MKKRNKLTERWVVPIKVGRVKIEVPGLTQTSAKANANAFITEHLQNVKKIESTLPKESAANKVGESDRKSVEQRLGGNPANLEIKSPRLAARRARFLPFGKPTT